MAASSQEPVRESHADQFPLLMERCDSHPNNEHVIDVERGSEVSSSNSNEFGFSHGINPPHTEDRPTTRTQASSNQSSSSSLSPTTSRSSSFARRSEGFGHRHWSPFNSGFWISIELAFTLTQIIASLIVLCLSRHEHPQAPLFAWVIGYTAGCFASLPVLYWRFLHRNQGAELGSAQPNQGSSTGNSAPNSYVTVSLGQPSEQGDHLNGSGASYDGQTLGIPNSRFNLIVDHLKMALDCFFAVWFVVGNVWIFGGHASASGAPNLYRLCVVYLTLSCIGYAMPFILCAMICCCLPCIISILGIREDMNHVRGASEESIDALPTYKFKVKKDEGGNAVERDSDGVEGGIVAAGTEKERAISGEDAVCCICLAGYVDDDELRELPCSHFFHSECVDKWLKINAMCPLCKFNIVERVSPSPPPMNPEQQT